MRLPFQAMREDYFRKVLGADEIIWIEASMIKSLKTGKDMCKVVFRKNGKVQEGVYEFKG